MDRFTGRDSDFRDDRAPRNPMSKFVSSGQATAAAPDFGKIEIKASRRQVQQAQAAAAAAALGQLPPQRAPAPVWVGQPPPGAELLASKDGMPLESIALARPMTVFGRGQAADVVLDHPSLSRQHAALCYRQVDGQWVLLDLGSVHGTFVDGKPVGKDHPVALTPGAQLRFGGSSRSYTLRAAQAVGPSSRDPDSGAGEGTKEQAESAEAGPRMDDQPGRFAGLVQETIVQGSSAAAAAKRRPPETRKRQAPPLTPVAAKSRLYDKLPPPSSTERRPA